jgi:hypothetical protein
LFVTMQGTLEGEAESMDDRRRVQCTFSCASLLLLRHGISATAGRSPFYDSGRGTGCPIRHLANRCVPGNSKNCVRAGRGGLAAMEATVAATFSQRRPRFHKLDRDVLVPQHDQTTQGRRPCAGETVGRQNRGSDGQGHHGRRNSIACVVRPRKQP